MCAAFRASPLIGSSGELIITAHTSPYPGLWWCGNVVPTPFCTSYVTWRFRFFLSVPACSAWSSI